MSRVAPALAPETLERLRGVSTATLAMQLLKRGLRAVWMDGPRPLQPVPARLVGEAFTLRFVPMREDLSTPESYARPGSLREAIEAMPAGVVAVIDARGARGCGTLGDILAARMQTGGVAGVVTDGAVRDSAELRALGLPVFCAGAAAPPSIAGLHFADWQVPVGCGGAAVLPGDLVVGDADGCVVLPRALADAIARDAPEQERFEAFVQMKVRQGAAVLGLYPPSEQALAEYREWSARAGED